MNSNRPDVVELLQQLIAIPSLPGQEGDLARWIVAFLEERGSSAEIDAAGNVVARAPGRGDAPPMAFNTHLDHVDVGDPARWPHPPFAGAVADGCVWGRGAVDIKGPLAAQMCAFLRLVDDPPPGDVFLTAVVQEEIGGLGARRLIERCPAQVFVVGEPSRSQVRCGHRGRVEVVAHAVGRSCHASVPHEGRNPLFALARFLLELEQAELPSNPVLGSASAVPTLLRTDQTSSNVVPGEVWQTIDYRCTPEQDAAAIVESLQAVAARARGGGAEAVEISVPSTRVVSWTGDELEMPADNPAYLLDFDLPEVLAARTIVAEQTGRDAGVGTWAFATDGGHFAAAGLVPVGFGPGDDLLAHTVDERIEIDELRAAVGVYEAMGRDLTSRAG